MDKIDALEALRRDRGGSAEPTLGHRWGWVVGAGLVILLLAGIGGAVWWLSYPRPVAVRAVEVMAEGGALSASVLNASGYVVAQLQATVAAQTTGMVTAVLVQEGDRVEQGQVLARLDDVAAQAAAAASQSQIDADLALVPQYEAQLAKDERSLARSSMLAAQDAISQSSLDAAVATVKVDRAMLAHAKEQTQVDRKNFELAKTFLSYTVIRAPFAGVVTERYAHPGEMISPQAVGGFTQTGICTLVDMSSLEVDVDINEAFIPRLHAGQSAEIALDAYPDWRMQAHVVAIVPTANQQKATVKVRVGFDKLDARVLPQMSAQVWFESDAVKPGEPTSASISMPRAAIRGGDGRAFVYRVDGDIVRRVAVRTVPGRAETVRVLSGLHDGDRIVIWAEGPLADGQKVRGP